MSFYDYLYIIAYYVLITNFGSILLLIYEYHLKSKIKLGFRFFRYNFMILLIIILFIGFGFSGIEINKLNKNDLIYVPYLNCSYSTASKNIVIENSYSFCSGYNESANYSVSYLKGYSINETLFYNLTVSNNKLNLQFPEEKGIYAYKIYENGKIHFENYDLKVVSFEEFLETDNNIKKEKKAYFIGAWAFFFASILFIIQLENRFKQNG